MMVFPVGGAVCRPPLASIDEGLKGKSMLKRFALLCWCLFGANALAAGPNANIKYYGYDWLDFYETATPSFSATEALKAITDTGFSMTNLNVVHTMASLNLPVCAGGTCAVNIQAGSGRYRDRRLSISALGRSRTAVAGPQVPGTPSGRWSRRSPKLNISPAPFILSMSRSTFLPYRPREI